MATAELEPARAARTTMNTADAPDVLSFFLDLANASEAIERRLDGQVCARCGTAVGLRPGGHAYTRTPDGCLGWAVRVCGACWPAAPLGGDLMAAVAWVVAAGAVEEDVIDAWRSRRAVSVPVGRSWDVVRVSRPLGWAVLARLPRHVAGIGPVLEVPARETVEFLIPPGAASGWPARRELRDVFRVGPRGTSQFPALDLTLADGRRACCGRRWLTRVEPHRRPTTHGGALLECLLAEYRRRGEL
ncbi:hypothetical protein [Streptomyces hainanensis]|uniref:DNA primase n=1 Tax=Streptomyces hainanensis TaxID=402648 RepID=A0A4R4TS83_9ACTN|nr:hypothetical protein [Streptomyces hainanensis]TDC78272.1 hypothetical protein E1283_05420 [Streptomyces hainanensis]